MTPPEDDQVDFWFDPLCPWAWITSRWIVGLEPLRRVRLRWHLMSLALIHERRDLKPQRRQAVDLYWGPIRVMAAAVRTNGEQVAGPLYTAMGTRLHGTGGLFEEMHAAPDDRYAELQLAALSNLEPVIAASLADAGLPADLIDAMTSADFDEDLRASHERVPAGTQNRHLLGVPTISVNGHAGQFGPVISEILRGDRAVRLWDAFRAVATEEAFFEIKRVTTRAPLNVTGTTSVG